MMTYVVLLGVCGTMAIRLRLMFTRNMYTTQQLVNNITHKLNRAGTTSVGKKKTFYLTNIDFI